MGEKSNINFLWYNKYKLEFVGVSYGMDNHICTSDVVYIPK